eukprot:4818802-Pleurochrysis_carterae.AAC.1
MAERTKESACCHRQRCEWARVQVVAAGLALGAVLLVHEGGLARGGSARRNARQGCGESSSIRPRCPSTPGAHNTHNLRMKKVRTTRTRKATRTKSAQSVEMGRVWAIRRRGEGGHALVARG